MKCKICNYEHDTETCSLSDNIKIVVNESDLVAVRNQLLSVQIVSDYDNLLIVEINKLLRNIQNEVENIIINSREVQ